MLGQLPGGRYWQRTAQFDVKRRENTIEPRVSASAEMSGTAECGNSDSAVRIGNAGACSRFLTCRAKKTTAETTATPAAIIPGTARSQGNGIGGGVAAS